MKVEYLKKPMQGHDVTSEVNPKLLVEFYEDYSNIYYYNHYLEWDDTHFGR